MVPRGSWTSSGAYPDTSWVSNMGDGTLHVHPCGSLAGDAKLNHLREKIGTYERYGGVSIGVSGIISIILVVAQRLV
jgi:hypothetical protein